MPKTQLATFRLDADTWEEFQKYARRQGSTASALLLGFVDSCLAGDDYKPADMQKIQDMVTDAVSDRTAWINSTLVEEIHLLQARLAILENRLNNLDSQDNEVHTHVDSEPVATSLNNLDSQDNEVHTHVDGEPVATSLNNLDSQDNEVHTHVDGEPVATSLNNLDSQDNEVHTHVDGEPVATNLNNLDSQDNEVSNHVDSEPVATNLNNLDSQDKPPVEDFIKGLKLEGTSNLVILQKLYEEGYRVAGKKKADTKYRNEHLIPILSKLGLK
jgi:hypothetical protein